MAEKTIEERQVIAQSYIGDRSICSCGHTGDKTPNSPAGNHDGVQAHGACRFCGMACPKFSWKSFTSDFKDAVT